MKVMKRVKAFFNRCKMKPTKDMPSRMEWIFVGIMSILFFLTMFYGDNFGIFLTYFWTNEDIFRGNNLNFIASQELPYGILHQWVCQLWVLPVNIIYHIIGTGFNSIPAILWYKLFTTVGFILCAIETGKIAHTLGIADKQIKWLQLFMLSSLLVALPVFHIAQTDVTYLLLMLWGVHAFIKDDYKKFLICFALAIPLKIVSFFVFIPMVLLKEKRILYVLRDCILGLIIFPIEEIIYFVVGYLNRLMTPAQQAVEQIVTAEKEVEDAQYGFMSHFYNKATYFEFPAVRKELFASLLVFAFVLLFIWCYTQQKKDEQEWKKTCIFAVTATLGIFFLMASPSPYWILVLYPFLFLMIFQNQDRFRINMILQFAFTLTMFLVFVIDTFWVFGGAQTFDWLFLTELGWFPGNHESQGGPNIKGYLLKLGVDKFMPVIVACCLASILAILVINYPKFKYNEELEEGYRIRLQHGMAIFSIGVLVSWYIVNLLLLSRY